MQLIVVDPTSGRRKSVPLSGATMSVGSAVDCDLVLPGNDIAMHALTVTWEGDHLVVEAVGDTTFLHNEQKSRGAILHVGDVMRLGSYQLVVAPIAGAAAPAPAPAPPPAPEPRPAAAAPRPAARPAPVSARAAAAFDGGAEPEERSTAARRRPTKQHDGHFGLLFMVALAGGLGFAWYRGWFDGALPEKYASPRKPDPKADVAQDPKKPDEKTKESGKAGSAGTTGSKPDGSGSGDGKSGDGESAAHENGSGDHGSGAGEAGGSDDGSASEESSSADVDETFAKVAKLLAEEEYSSCRWLLWQLHPKEAADLRRVAQRRKEVDDAAAKGGAAHLKHVDDLITKGRLQTALNFCLEESIDRFRGTETWYALLDKADAIEAIIDETVPEDRRLSAKRKHGRTRPPDLATRAPPPVKVASLEPELVPMETTRKRPTERGREPERPGEKGRDPTPPNEPEKAIEPPSPEQLALREKVVAAVAALAAAKPAAVEAKLKALAAVAEAAGPAAVEPLVERAAAIGDLLDAAPEKAALAELRVKCQSLKAARDAAFTFLDDPVRYFMLDPKAPGDVSRGDEMAAAQKEADQLVDAVRDQWGSELGGAPAPLVNLSEGYGRLVQEAQAIDALLAAQKAELPAKTELLATRLLPNWSRKIHVRNYALDVVERERLDRNQLIRVSNQRVRDVDGDALEMLSTVNAYREMFGRSLLQWDGKLATSAQLLATLRTKEAKAYKDSDPQPLPEPRQGNEGGVNLLRGKFSARQGLQVWTRIAGAHRNLLDAEHRAVGIGVDAKYWVAKFGKFVPGTR